MTELERAHGRSPWDYVQDWDLELMGEEIADAEVRRRWARAFCIGGGLGYIWRELAAPLNEIIYSLLELRPGDRVLVIGEAIKAVGWDDDIRDMIGAHGQLDAVEIIKDGRAAVNGGKRGRTGRIGTWEWTYTRDAADASYDAVAVLQATQHCDDWSEMAGEVLRVLKPGRRFLSAEAVYGGTTFRQRINADVHVRQWFDKLFEGVDVDNVSYYSGDELRDAFGGGLEESRTFEWHGIEMFWGRKGG